MGSWLGYLTPRQVPQGQALARVRCVTFFCKSFYSRGDSLNSGV